MTDIPQLGPEVFVDDVGDVTKQARTTVSPMLSPMLSPPSPLDIGDPRSSFIAHGLDGAARHRRGSSLGQFTQGPLGSPRISPRVSPRGSPQLSPHRPTNSAYSFEGGELTEGAAGSAHSSRRGSAAENVLEVLDNSAWGESIRRSFTMRRPDREGTA